MEEKRIQAEIPRKVVEQHVGPKASGHCSQLPTGMVQVRKVLEEQGLLRK